MAIGADFFEIGPIVCFLQIKNEARPHNANQEGRNHYCGLNCCGLGHEAWLKVKDMFLKKTRLHLPIDVSMRLR